MVFNAMFHSVCVEFYLFFKRWQLKNLSNLKQYCLIPILFNTKINTETNSEFFPACSQCLVTFSHVLNSDCHKEPNIHVCMYAVMSDSATPWTVTHQAPLSMEFSRQEY